MKRILIRTRRRGDLGSGFRSWGDSGIVCQCFADEVARKAANNNVLAQFRDLGADQFSDRLIRILDEPLLQQTNRAIEFLQFSVEILFITASGLPLT